MKNIRIGIFGLGRGGSFYKSITACGGEVLARKKLAATTPGAMEKLTIPQDKLAGLEGEVVVSASHKEVLA